jgi:predicted GIY-YIG superfamily endonuclease
MSYVYCLESRKHKTYIGATVDVERRLRQHNREIKGGAKATRNHTWSRLCYVSGFPNWTSALAFEWRWKNLSRKQSGTPIEKKMKALYSIFQLDKPTRNSIPYIKWEQRPVITWENDRAYHIYTLISR